MRNFSLSIYTFHLRQTLADPLDRVSTKAELIWENLIAISQDLPFLELQATALKSQLVCYNLVDKDSGNYKHHPDALNLVNEWLTRDGKSIKLTTIAQQELNVGGSLQPFLLHDTYAFDLTLLVPEITPGELNKLSIKSLFFKESPNFIGQTFWLYGEAEVSRKECQELSQEIADKFLELTDYQGRLVSSEGILLKMPLFEYELIDKSTKKSISHYRLLVSINNESIKFNPNTYNWTREILWTYHKIEYVYKQAQESYSKARKAYSDLEAKIQEFKPDRPLEELQKLLEAMPEISMQYQRQLRNLQAHYTTIKTNRINYRNYLQKFWRQGDISSWQEFDEIACQRYLNQIETYLSYIQPGKDLINEFINTLRGLVEVEQAKSDRAAEIREKESDRQLQETLQENERKEKDRDRNLQTLIAAVGVGIGASGVAATASPYILEAKPKEYSYNLALSLLFSLVVGVAGGAIAVKIMQSYQKRSKKS